MTNLHCPGCGQVADGSRVDPDYFRCSTCLSTWLIVHVRVSPSLDEHIGWLWNRDGQKVEEPITRYVRESNESEVPL